MLWAISTQSTSKYDGWNEKVTLWRAKFYFNGKQSKYYVDNERDAAKTRNRVHKNMGILPQNSETNKIPNRRKKNRTSQYKGVYFQKKCGNWYVRVCLNDGKYKYGGVFHDEIDAAKRVNQLCEEMELPPQNPGILGVPNQQKKKASQYKGVYYHKQTGKWHARLGLERGQAMCGRYFNNELDAAKKVNQLCEEMKIPLQNPGIVGMPNQQHKQKTSQYKGVCWKKERNRWFVQLRLQAGKKKSGGTFKDELDAAKRVNQLCEEMEIPHKNPGISAIPNQPWKPKQQTSQYKGVHWNKRHKKWAVELCLHGGRKKYGGLFKNELHAAQKVNHLCKEFKIPHKNHRIGTITNLQNEYNQINHTEGANSVISLEITPKAKTDNDGTNKTKRKRENDQVNDNSPVDKYYFYDFFLK